MTSKFNIVVIIICSLFLFYLCFCTSFGYAEYSEDQRLLKEKPKSLSSSQNHDPSNHSNPDFSTLLLKKDNFSVSHVYEASIECLGAQAGYYTIEQNYNAKLFYFFFKSQRSMGDPVVIWLNGGPGVSSTIGLFYENGPFHIADDFSLLLNTHSWNEVSNILYIEQPIGTGLSYSDNDYQIRHNRIDVANDLYYFLQKFFQDDRVQYLENDFFITGQSYAGHYATALALRIQQEKKVSGGFTIKLKGMALGNALIDLGIQYATMPYFAWRNNSITREQYLRINNTVPTCTTFVKGCGPGNETSCLDAFTNCDSIFLDVLNTINRNIGVCINYFDLRKPREGPNTYDYSKIETFLNMYSVKTALRIPDKTFATFSSQVYEALKGDWAKNTLRALSILLDDGIKILSYNGEFDLICNFIGAMKVILDLPWSGQEKFSTSNVTPFEVDNKEVGLRRTYGNLTYLKIYDAGHMVPMDQPRVSLEMIRRWMEGEFN